MNAVSRSRGLTLPSGAGAGPASRHAPASLDASVGMSPRVSLRANLAWSVGGTAVYAVSQWLVLTLVAKLAGTEALGGYALGQAIVTPIDLWLRMKLRSSYVADVEGKTGFGEYVAVRVLTQILGLALIAGWTWLAGLDASTAAVVLAVGVLRLAEAGCDLYMSVANRREDMVMLGLSRGGRGLAIALAIGLSLAIGASLAVAVLVAAGAVALVCRFVDRAEAAKHESVAPTWNAMKIAALLWLMLPAGLSEGVFTLGNQAPAYVLEFAHGTGAVGLFAALAALVSLARSVAIALGQALLPRFAKLHHAGEHRQFWKLVAATGAGLAVAGASGAALAALFGDVYLVYGFSPEFAGLERELVLTTLAATLAAGSVLASQLLLAVRRFRTLLAVDLLTALASLPLAAVLASRDGLAGAVWALLIAALVRTGLC
ncbi:MAG TPA: hypothetical protein VGE52_11925, partial [Pirellulales bacterium]